MDLWLWGIWFVGVVVNSEELIVKEAKGFILRSRCHSELDSEHCSLFQLSHL